MAIGFRATGARTKADVSVSGPFQNVGMPAGHVSGDWLLLTVVTDDNTGPVTPSGWSLLGGFSPGPSTSSPYAGRPHVNLYHRMDTGALGSSVAMTFSTNSWPTGNPYVLAWIEAYTGVDSSGPVEIITGNSTTSTSTTHAHPQLTTVAANDWLISIRAVGADAAKTFTNSVGTDVERVDDNVGQPAAPSAVLYDTNAALAAGVQTQRTTTASAAVEYGSVAVSIAIKPTPPANQVFASAGVAQGTGTAYDAGVTASSGPWALCTDPPPQYDFTIDWNNAEGTLYNTAEFGSSGTTVTINDVPTDGSTKWDDVIIDFGATLTYDTSRAAHGSRSIRLTTTGASQTAYASWTTALGGAFPTLWFRGLFYWPANPATDTTVISFRNPSGMCANIQINTAGKLQVQNAGFGTAFTMASSIPLNDWWRVEGYVTGDPSAGVVELKFFRGADDDLPTETMSATGQNTGGQLTVIQYGMPFSKPSIDMSMDDLAVSSTGYVGSANNAAPDIVTDISITYGRDQNRQLNPGAVGNASFSVINVDRAYSPENTTSPLAGSLEPARPMRGSVAFGGNLYPLFDGRVDDYNLKADFSDRTVDFTFLDGMSLLQGVKLSTGVYGSMRTGELISTILDLANWDGPRDIDLGASVIPFWWVEGTDALTAITDLVKSEGPPSIAYQAPDGTFIFRDRHHRLLRSQSISSQATFAAGMAFDCDSTPPEGFDYTKPFEYAHGWRDIVNSVTFDVAERTIDSAFTAVWNTDDTISLSNGEGQEIEISTSDPFVDAQTPAFGTDFQSTGGGALNVVLSRTSGQSVKITLLAVGGPILISGMQLRARSIPVRRTVKVFQQDTGSISQHGERSYPDSAPWANVNDSFAIANMILLHYAQRRPTVQIRIVSQDPNHFIQVLRRTVSDRIHIINDEVGLADDFYVERVTHNIVRINQEGKPPVHSVVLGCEKNLSVTANPFTFDKRGAGFDDGVFDPIQMDDPSTVFIFDHPTQGQFDLGQFGT